MDCYAAAVAAAVTARLSMCFKATFLSWWTLALALSTYTANK